MIGGQTIQVRRAVQLLGDPQDVVVALQFDLARRLAPNRNRGRIGTRRSRGLLVALVMFREARHGDLSGILRLYHQLQPDDPVLEDGSDEAVFREILASSDLHLFVLEMDGVVVATTYLNVIPNMTRSASPYAVVENVVVEEEMRGEGLGKRIMAGTLQAAWDAGCYKTMLLTGSQQPSTHAFYRACGFSGSEKTGFVARPS